MNVDWPLAIAATPLAPALGALLPWWLARARAGGVPLAAAAGIATVVVPRSAAVGDGVVIERIDGEDAALVLSAAAVAVPPEEPLGLAVSCACLERAIAPSRGIMQDVRRFTHRAADGEEVAIERAEVVLGDAAALRAAGIEPLPEPSGREVVHIAWRGAAVGFLVLRAADREGLGEALAALAPLRVVLATPDDALAARLAAGRLSIDEALARCPPELLPEQIRALRADGPVATLGAAGTGADLDLPPADDPADAVRPLLVARRWLRATRYNVLGALALQGGALVLAQQGRLDTAGALLGTIVVLALVTANSARVVRP